METVKQTLLQEIGRYGAVAASTGALAPERSLLAAVDRACGEGLTFATLRVANVTRCEEVFHPCTEWSPTDWATALAGETGEACNLIKKWRRGDAVNVEDIGRELADIVIYADLLAHRFGLDLGQWVQQKFNEVSLRQQSTVQL